MSKNKVVIGDNNSIKNTNIAGNNINTVNTETKHAFWDWVLKHLGSILSAIISGAVSAFTAWLITYLIMK